MCVLGNFRLWVALLVWCVSMVSSEKEKFCFDLFRQILLQSVSRKNANNSQKIMQIQRKKMQKFCEQMRKFCEKYRIFKNMCKIQTFIKVKEEKLFIWHNKTSNIELWEQRIPQFLGINCCSFKTHGFHKIFAFCENIFEFSRSFYNLQKYIRISNFRKISLCFCVIYIRKILKKFAKCDRKFSRNISCTGNPSQMLHRMAPVKS